MNMLKLAAVVAATLAVCALTGCKKQPLPPTDPEYMGVKVTPYVYKICADGTEYLVYYTAGGVTPHLNTEGKPRNCEVAK